MNFTRNLGLSLVAVFIITVTLTFLTFALVAKDFGQKVSTDVKDKISVSVYFKDGVDEDTILAIKEDLVEIEHVKEINYISKQKSLEEFISRHSDNSVLMAALAEVGNPFQPSINIISDSPEGYEIIVATLEESPSNVFFEKVDYDERKVVIEDVFHISSTVEKVGLIFAIIMGLVSILTIFNVVRMAIYAMKEEISIMRLVGVSRRYIVSSFVSQGVIIGLAGFLANIILFASIATIFSSKIASCLAGFSLSGYLLSNIWPLLAIQFGVAIILGSVSSLAAIAKYLKV